MLEYVWIAASAAAAAAAPIIVVGEADRPDREIEITTGVSAGILGLDLTIPDIGSDLRDNNGIVYGVFAAADKPLRDNLFAGLEVNAHLGTRAVSSDLGASLRLGLRAESGTKVYVRAGYQWVNLNRDNFTGALDPQTSTSVNNYLIGGGVEFPVYRQLTLRTNFDTVGFDIVRATSGFAYKF
ncbi:MAG: outer membrane protein [Erythrobacter sp.]